MANELSNKYFVRKSTSASWEDITTKFAGVKVLSLDGLNELGDSVNVYDEQWVGSATEDVMVAGSGIIRKNVDLSLTFIVGSKYGASDTQAVHDTFVNYMCKQGALYVRSNYTSKQAYVICMKGYKPTTQRLHRGQNSYIIGTITLHCIAPPASV